MFTGIVVCPAVQASDGTWKVIVEVPVPEIVVGFATALKLYIAFEIPADLDW
jgi:hypothetical protein